MNLKDFLHDIMEIKRENGKIGYLKKNEVKTSFFFFLLKAEIIRIHVRKCISNSLSDLISSICTRFYNVSNINDV